MLPTTIFSHGFGVERTARGMFSDIADRLHEQETILFDYNRPTEKGLEVAPFFVQSKILREKIEHLLKEGDGIPVDIVCHSQGAVAAALLESTEGIRRAVFIAPPKTLSKERMEKTFGSRPGTKRHPNRDFSELPRRDGSITAIPPGYWTDFEKVDLETRYRDFMRKVPTYVIFAENDEVLGTDQGSIEAFEFAKSIKSIPGNHDFTDSYREGLVEIVSETLFLKNDGNE